MTSLFASCKWQAWDVWGAYLRYIWTLNGTLSLAQKYNKVWRATFRRETSLSGGVYFDFIPAILTCYKLVLNTCTYTYNIKYTIYENACLCTKMCTWLCKNLFCIYVHLLWKCFIHTYIYICKYIFKYMYIYF